MEQINVLVQKANHSPHSAKLAAQMQFSISESQSPLPPQQERKGKPDRRLSAVKQVLVWGRMRSESF